MANDTENLGWMNRKWRPAMAWLYMLICLFDFIIAPALWSVIQIKFKGTVDSQWRPITLEGAGFFHIAMGAILGITAYGRTQEKLNGTGTYPQSTYQRGYHDDSRYGRRPNTVPRYRGKPGPEQVEDDPIL